MCTPNTRSALLKLAIIGNTSTRHVIPIANILGVEVLGMMAVHSTCSTSTAGTRVCVDSVLGGHNHFSGAGWLVAGLFSVCQRAQPLRQFIRNIDLMLGGLFGGLSSISRRRGTPPRQTSLSLLETISTLDIDTIQCACKCPYL